uniref:Uncharacterized protein n=1 Tax=Anguilla anguilla TaxID=7936 RepID=A0A0E9T533_ANGAN
MSLSFSYINLAEIGMNSSQLGIYGLYLSEMRGAGL